MRRLSVLVALVLLAAPVPALAGGYEGAGLGAAWRGFNLCGNYLINVFLQLTLLTGWLVQVTLGLRPDGPPCDVGHRVDLVTADGNPSAGIRGSETRGCQTVSVVVGRIGQEIPFTYTVEDRCTPSFSFEVRGAVTFLGASAR